MPALPLDADPDWPSTSDDADATCAYRWTDAAACPAGDEHSCSRMSQDHRTHLCSCNAVDVQPSNRLRVGSSRRQPNAAARTSWGR
jgi:hypothetical protein